MNSPRFFYVSYVLVQIRLDKNQKKHQYLCGFQAVCPIITHSSTRRTIPVAFVYLSPFLRRIRPPLCKGGWQKSLISDWGIVLCRYLTIPPSRLRRATSLCTREALVPTIILQITLLVSANGRRKYNLVYFLLWI